MQFVAFGSSHSSNLPIGWFYSESEYKDIICIKQNLMFLEKFLLALSYQPRPQGFSLKKWVGREKALASAGHVHSLNILEKLIYMQPAGFALTEVERSNNGK